MSPPEMSRDALQGNHTMQPMIFVSIKVQQTKILTISGFNTLNKIHTYSFNSGAGYFKMQQDQKKLSNWVRGFKSNTFFVVSERQDQQQNDVSCYRQFNEVLLSK